MFYHILFVSEINFILTPNILPNSEIEVLKIVQRKLFSNQGMSVNFIMIFLIGRQEANY